MDITEGQRLKDYLNVTGKHQKSLTDITGIRKENVSDWMHGKKSIPTKHLTSILRSYTDICARWLLTGEGEMLCDTDGKKAINELDERSMILKSMESMENEIAALKMALKAKDELLDMYRGKPAKANIQPVMESAKKNSKNVMK